jgi:GTP-binding protein
MQIRNVAIVAHVDHGKTTLVDGLLRQSGAVSDHTELAERAMDSGDQERERGITILSKNTAVEWKGVRINVVDTPGHSDFGSEVERVLKMVDAVLLLVDAAEGPMPQTRFVLSKSLELGLKVLVCLNKIDRQDSRADTVLGEVFDLFSALEATDEQLDFPHIYACARDGYAMREPGDERKDLDPLFDMLLEHVPEPKGHPEDELQLQVATLDYSEFLGRIAIGRVERGTIKRGKQAVVCKLDGTLEPFKVTKLMTFQGLERVDTEEALAGDIVALAGAGSATVGDTICPAGKPDPLPAIGIDEPTMSMTFTPNNSGFAGQEGKYVTSRQIRDRLERELIANVGIRVEPGVNRDAFVVSGRGTLHLSVLIEAMRREGFELSVSQPRVIEKEEDGKTLEPFEELVLDCGGDYQGIVIQKLNERGGALADLKLESDGRVRMKWIVPSRGLIGYRSEFLTDTRGTGTLVHVFDHYGPKQARTRLRQNGVLVALETCEVRSHALSTLQDRGQMFVAPGDRIYSGQITGLHSRDNDLVVNPGRGKKHSNVRAAGSDDTIKLTPPREFTLEEALEFIAHDELVEVTPKSIRLRKRDLDHNVRKREARADKAKAKA